MVKEDTGVQSLREWKLEGDPTFLSRMRTSPIVKLLRLRLVQAV